MKTIQTIGLLGAMLTAACVASAQVLNTNVGIPIGSLQPGTITVVVTEFGREGQVTPVAGQSAFAFTTAFPGDLILVNPTGGTAPSNWLADIRFFNPQDPTGTLGLAATETQAYYPADVAGGFAAFALFPTYNFVPADLVLQGFVLGSESLFGPVGGINAGQLGIITFLATPAAATPEPGSIALLASFGLTGAAFFARRRKNARKAL
jgi:hypothetical protein